MIKNSFLFFFDRRATSTTTTTTTNDVLDVSLVELVAKRDQLLMEKRALNVQLLELANQLTKVDRACDLANALPNL